MTQPTVKSALDAIRSKRIVAVVRAPSADLALEAATVLISCGISAIEIAFTTPDAASAIEKCIGRHGEEALIGAGTVVSKDHIESARQAGAEFLVSPGTLGDLADAMVGTGLLTMTGILTPTEILRALQHNVHVLKVFPGSLGGPGYLSALRGPFPDLKFMPTGGVSATNLSQWLTHGAFAVGAGSDLIPAASLASRDFDDVAARAMDYVTALTQFDRDREEGL